MPEQAEAKASTDPPERSDGAFYPPSDKDCVCDGGYLPAFCRASKAGNPPAPACRPALYVVFDGCDRQGEPRPKTCNTPEIAPTPDLQTVSEVAFPHRIGHNLCELRAQLSRFDT